MIRTCFSSLPFDVDKEGNPTRYSKCEPPPKKRAGIFGEGCEILELAPSFRRYSFFYQWFQEKGGESLDRSLFASPPLTDHSSPYFPPPSHLQTTHLQLAPLYVTKLPALYMWFLQERCGRLFTIINHNHVFVLHAIADPMQSYNRKPDITSTISYFFKIVSWVFVSSRINRRCLLQVSTCFNVLPEKALCDCLGVSIACYLNPYAITFYHRIASILSLVGKSSGFSIEGPTDEL